MPKFIYTFLVTTLCTINPCLSQWYPQTSGTSAKLSSVCFTDQNTGWICGFEILLKTTNSGQTWQSNFLTGYHNGIRFINASTGFICSDNGLLYRTTDAGLTWLQRQSGTTSHLMSIEFLNQNTGLITGSGDIVLKTTDGGQNWNDVFPDSGYYLFGSHLVNENVYYVAGSLGTVFKTVNAGITWTPLSVNMVNPFFTVRFTDENIGWALGCCGMFFRTSNGGSSWTELRYLTFGASLLSSVFANQNTGWSAGAAGNIVRTTDGGFSWDSLVSGTTNTLYSIFFLNNSTGWSVGYNGTILKTTNGGGPGYSIGIENTGTEIPAQFQLFQNYPNPFNPKSNIKYQISKAGIVNLRVFNILGNEVELLVSERQQPGIYEIEFNASNLPSGIYFYTLNAGDYTDTKKMVLLK